MNSIFTISLDFELHWGVHDKRSVAQYQQHLHGVRAVVPALLTLFRQYQIHATWATVGMLFAENKSQLLAWQPSHLPQYLQPHFSPYPSFKNIGNHHQDDPYHYALDVIKQIKKYPHQEIGSHTFSHYYCLEAGQTPLQFKADLEAALLAAQAQNIELKSLVFPRNQFSAAYINVCEEMGFSTYRGNEQSWLYAAKSGSDERLYRRALRLLDAYVNVSGHHTFSLESRGNSGLVNIPASRFLRPYSRQLKMLEKLRLQRILKSMTYAAQQQQVYHLWWHPHNFGAAIDENLHFLGLILQHYQQLQKQYRMRSLNMGEIGEQILRNKS